MGMKIVADSSANLFRPQEKLFASVPLKIVAGDREFVDDGQLDVAEMNDYLGQYHGKSGSSCPNVGDWLDAFGEADAVFGVAITSNLSGAYNALCQAAQVYTAEHPERKVCCLDSLSTGPEMLLIVEKLEQLIAQGLSFEEIEGQIRAYMNTTHLLFMLESVDNLAKNGRVSSLVAKAVGFLNIRIVGKASDHGTLQQLHKCRGEKKGLDTLLLELEKQGYRGGRMNIAHVCNEELGSAFRQKVLEVWPEAQVDVIPTGGLCAFYAEQGGLLVGFEE